MKFVFWKSQGLWRTPENFIASVWTEYKSKNAPETSNWHSDSGASSKLKKDTLTLNFSYNQNMDSIIND